MWGMSPATTFFQVGNIFFHRSRGFSSAARTGEDVGRQLCLRALHLVPPPHRVLGERSLIRGETDARNLAGIRTPAKQYLFCLVSENKGDPKKAKQQKGELILGKETGE